MARVWRRRTSPKGQEKGDKATPNPSGNNQRSPLTGNPQQVGLMYAEVVMGKEPTNFITSVLTTLAGAAGDSSKKESWMEVRFKLPKRLSKEEMPSLHQRLENMKRSPPTISIPMGPIQVCGQCLQPGHRANECRHMLTYRRCGEVGHREINTGDLRRLERPRLAVRPLVSRDEPGRPPKSEMMRGKEHRIHNRDGNGADKKHCRWKRDLSCALGNVERKMALGAKQFLDGRFIVACPSPEEVREMEST
ncbi:hypothetical protein J5N97_027836 [Dioscorea zingiberensis]|uniref:CCHC-type domain-containing protein n=1 Tax=Dioscorea zingiberensis TaxID=325984 RepID=A0A9D5BXX2_9LILI|nr:hypothetical protein J5N97_027836 [Dioscorea zingiberensis]